MCDKIQINNCLMVVPTAAKQNARKLGSTNKQVKKSKAEPETLEASRIELSRSESGESVPEENRSKLRHRSVNGTFQSQRNVKVSKGKAGGKRGLEHDTQESIQEVRKNVAANSRLKKVPAASNKKVASMLGKRKLDESAEIEEFLSSDPNPMNDLSGLIHNQLNKQVSSLKKSKVAINQSDDQTDMIEIRTALRKISEIVTQTLPILERLEQVKTLRSEKVLKREALAKSVSKEAKTETKVKESKLPKQTEAKKVSRQAPKVTRTQKSDRSSSFSSDEQTKATQIPKLSGAAQKPNPRRPAVQLAANTPKPPILQPKKPTKPVKQRSVSASERKIPSAMLERLKKESEDVKIEGNGTVLSIDFGGSVSLRKGRGHVDVAGSYPPKAVLERDDVGPELATINQVGKEKVSGEPVGARLLKKISVLENPTPKVVIWTGRKVDPSNSKTRGSGFTRSGMKISVSPSKAGSEAVTVQGGERSKSGMTATTQADSILVAEAVTKSNSKSRSKKFKKSTSKQSPQSPVSSGSAPIQQPAAPQVHLAVTDEEVPEPTVPRSSRSHSPAPKVLSAIGSPNANPAAVRTSKAESPRTAPTTKHINVDVHHRISPSDIEEEGTLGLPCK